LGLDHKREVVNPELRAELFEERGHSCEACRRDLRGDRFDVHHIDYGQRDNPDSLKILCNPCHNVVNVLTGLKWWFAQEMGMVQQKDASQIQKLRSRKEPFWMKPDFDKVDVYEE
jgi:hypothetical protein